MKNSTKEIISQFPKLDAYLPSSDNIILQDEALSKLNEVEQTFLKMAWFFENPVEGNFNLESLYKNLQDDWLSFSLKVIFIFFSEDTYLMKKPSFSLVTEGDEYLTQSQFVDYLNMHGETFTRSKLSTYIQRNSIPPADLVLSGRRFWKEKTCRDYLTGLQQKENQLEKKSNIRVANMKRNHKISVSSHLTDKENDLFLTVWANHNSSMSFEERGKYNLQNVVKIERNHAEKCLNVHYDNGNWWHYCEDGTWY